MAIPADRVISTYALSAKQKAFSIATLSGIGHAYEHWKRLWKPELSIAAKVQHCFIALFQAIPLIGMIAAIIEHIAATLLYPKPIYYAPKCENSTRLHDIIVSLANKEYEKKSSDELQELIHHPTFKPLLQEMSELLQQGKKGKMNLNTQDENGFTPLHTLIIYCSASDAYQFPFKLGFHLLTLLLDAKVHTNLRDKEGKTPLHRAYSKELALKLLQAGADWQAKDHAGYPVYQNETEIKEEVVKALVEFGIAQEEILQGKIGEKALS